MCQHLLWCVLCTATELAKAKKSPTWDMVIYCMATALCHQSLVVIERCTVGLGGTWALGR
jgi:hypothetical protein